jgi:hypothetical protein
MPNLYGPDLREIAQMQLDAAILFEQVANALKLIGEQYLTRVYGLVSRRFHLADWDASITRKLQAIDRTYSRLADRAAARRMEMLEWIIIILIEVQRVGSSCRNRSRAARNAASRSASDPTTRAGSGSGQWIRRTWPGTTGHTSSAQSVTTVSTAVRAMSDSPLARCREMSMPTSASAATASGCSGPGAEPALWQW